jgi:hypothetical protein
MVLVSFSEPAHVPMLLNGRKQQTTRLPRKNPIKIGDTLHCYFKSRLGKGTCKNCIEQECVYYEGDETTPCPEWNNFFGTAKVTEIIPLHEALKDKEEWAKLDGFDSFEDANMWFTATAGANWTALPYKVIWFDPEWVKGGDD